MLSSLSYNKYILQLIKDCYDQKDAKKIEEYYHLIWKDVEEKILFNGDFVHDIIELSESCNNPYAQHLLGLMYIHGKGIEVNTNKAMKLFRRSMEEGNVITSTYNLGVMYANGDGVEENPIIAAHYFLKSNEKESFQKIINLILERRMDLFSNNDNIALFQTILDNNKINVIYDHDKLPPFLDKLKNSTSENRKQLLKRKTVDKKYIFCQFPNVCYIS